MHSRPRVSIGVPVYNGAATLAESVESLLAQTYADFELIICDNGSSDATPEIAAAFRERDARVRYVRHAENIGANLNYSSAVSAARGDYMKWSSASDWCAPTFLERCLEALDRQRDAVLAVPRTRLFNGDASKARDYPHDFAIPEDAPYERLLRLLSDMALNNAMNGVIRMSALRRTCLIEPYYQADIVLMGHLALLGKFILLDEPLFYRRMEESTATALQDAAARMRHHYPRAGARTLFQGAKRYGGWVRAGLGAPMSPAQRVRVLFHIARMWHGERGIFIHDVRSVWHYLSAGLQRLSANGTHSPSPGKGGDAQR